MILFSYLRERLTLQCKKHCLFFLLHAPINYISSFTLSDFRTLLLGKFNPAMSENVFRKGVDQTTSFPELHACTASPDSKEEQLPHYCCCSPPLATPLSVSCEPGCQEGAKAKQRDTATFLTCSRSSCETGLCVVKVLIRPVRGNLRCNTAKIFCIFSCPKYSAELCVRGENESNWACCVHSGLVEPCCMCFAAWGAHLKQPGWIFRNLPSNGSIASLLSGCAAQRKC